MPKLLKGGNEFTSSSYSTSYSPEQASKYMETFKKYGIIILLILLVVLIILMVKYGFLMGLLYFILGSIIAVGIFFLLSFILAIMK